MQIGFALTQHCNLRCPHCIRDDVTTVRSLDVAFIRRVLDEALDLFDTVGVSLTGGEPLIHPQFADVVEALRERAVPYRFVSNGWHINRVLSTLERYPPEFVRLSLSGGDEEVHDAERGRGSFRRVLQSIALLTSRRIPASLSLLVDTRSRHQIAQTAELAASLGCIDFHVILPQPTPGSAARSSDIPLHDWHNVRRQVAALAAQSSERTRIVLDYGAPPESGEDVECDTMGLRRLYVDAHGRVSLCCQLSDYGNNDDDVVADLNATSLRDAFTAYQDRIVSLKRITRADVHDPLAGFACMRCARATGKLGWLGSYASSPWAQVPLIQIRGLQYA